MKTSILKRNKTTKSRLFLDVLSCFPDLFMDKFEEADPKNPQLLGGKIIPPDFWKINQQTGQAGHLAPLGDASVESCETWELHRCTAAPGRIGNYETVVTVT